MPSTRHLGPADAQEFWRSWTSGPVGALYLHIPFCLRKCAYCDFASCATPHQAPLMHDYARSLQAMVRRVGESGLLDSLATAYIGGGTPTMLAHDELGNLATTVCSYGSIQELSCEANPESLTPDHLAALRDGGATRISLGVQSFIDEELRALGRVHTAQKAREALQAAVASGLRVSCDLMGAIPYLTPQSFAYSIEQAIRLGLGHLSIYPLIIEEGTPFYAAVESGEMAQPSEDSEADAMLAAQRMLTAQGFLRYEVASYSRPGEVCLHNLAYWSGTPYLGFGVAAASMVDAAGYERLRQLMPQLPRNASAAARLRLSCTSSATEVAEACGDVEALKLEVESLTARGAAAEDLMLAARTTFGIGRELQERAYEAIGQDAVDATIDDLCERGLLEQVASGAYVPTQQGWLLGNEVYGALWDLASDN